ncbi:hypothetical protein IV203_030623 [Nitzschia inconspicua]|uniref:Uncharacterized protein n=1 Tax=Nitzschia inconspicua TaxID=303405 RepID=A0A9K3KPV8_9STRA|nr:hypothetical protein IV203_015961 [Nitzschia inconspicua]KAG7367880.1 hypothetical protein IV203_030623 [Nitzschia inconspicua]
MTFSFSLYAFFSWSVLVMALPPAAIQTLVDEQVAATHRSFLAASIQSRYRMLRRRHLQDASTDCLASYQALYEDPILLAEAETWLAVLEERSVAPDLSLCDITESSGICDYSDEVPGTQDLLDACTGAGGIPQSLEIDILCRLTLDGQPLNLTLDFPTIWECFPPNCEEELAAIFTSELDGLEVDLETAFSELGSAGSCEVVTDGSEDTPTPVESITSPPSTTAAAPVGGSDTSPPLAATPAPVGSDTSPPPAATSAINESFVSSAACPGAIMTRETLLSTLLVFVCGALVAM